MTSLCQRGSWFCLLLLFLALPAASQNTDVSRNLSGCLSGYGICNYNLLSLDELREVRAAERQKNLQTCRMGYGICNYNLLSQDELKEVKEDERRRNLQTCRMGYGICNYSLLGPDEMSSVREAERQRNLQTCRMGYGICNYSLLSPDELKTVREAEWQRNANNCRNGIGLCDRALLSKPSYGSVSDAPPIRVAQMPGGPTRTEPAATLPTPAPAPKSEPSPVDPIQKKNLTTLNPPVKKSAVQQSANAQPPRPPIPAAPPPTTSQPAPLSTSPSTTAAPNTPQTDEFSPINWLVVLAIIVILFNGRRIPQVMRRTGEGIRRIRSRIGRSNTSTARSNFPSDRHGTALPGIDWRDEVARQTAPPGNGYATDWSSDNSVFAGAAAAGNLCPIDARPLQVGQRVMMCRTPGCHTGYHPDCWEFLQRENRAACVSCGLASGVSASTLGTTSTETREEETALCPQCGSKNRINSWLPKAGFRCGHCKSHLFPSYADSFEATVVGLDSVRRYVGRMVVFRGDVLEMRKTQSGSYLLKCERGHTRNAFKLYIPENYVSAFRSTGTRIENYLGSTVEVRGLVQRHPRWNYEIVVTEPNAIRVVTAYEQHRMA
jgi:Sec-independent protein translocase protein TatA